MIYEEIQSELDKARRKFPAGFHSYHEGYGVMLEEVHELWDEIRKQNPDKAAMRAECIQIAAMAVRFIEELTPAE